jgi:hypothetical protein
LKPGFAVVLFTALIATAGAQDLKGPRISVLPVDWPAAMQDGQIADATALAQLNAGRAPHLSDIERSPIPVLLPADPVDAPDAAPFALSFFAAGPSGYDAAFVLRPDAAHGLADLKFARPTVVEITGSILSYELEDPTPPEDQPIKAMDAEFPGLRRLIHEGHVRFTWMRFGVPYVVSVRCRDIRPHSRRLSCRQADRIAAKFLRALRLHGGTPQATAAVAEPVAIERPAQTSPEFTYHGPGRLLPGTGYRRHPGRADYTVYASIRFPIADAPAYANSQSFMHWGDCNFTGRSPRRLHNKGTPYQCKVSGKPLVFDESARENYAYPWRDNFCETRDFSVGQCPGGWGHQGQDIRPSSCKLRNEGADRCLPYQHDVVAARDGLVLRHSQQHGLHLVVNTPTEHLRFRYLHMSPTLLTADGLVSGRRVREGEPLGKVGNYFRFPGGTTYHLHFDLQVPTRHGWVFVNPYMSLVAAYERLLGGRGTEIHEVSGDAAGDKPAASLP